MSADNIFLFVFTEHADLLKVVEILKYLDDMKISYVLHESKEHYETAHFKKSFITDSYVQLTNKQDLAHLLLIFSPDIDIINYNNKY